MKNCKCSFKKFVVNIINKNIYCENCDSQVDAYEAMEFIAHDNEMYRFSDSEHPTRYYNVRITSK